MHPHLLVGPVEAGLPGDEDRMFHLFECLLDPGLPPISSNDLLVGPVMVVREEDGPPKLSAVQPDSGVGAKVQHDVRILFENFHVEQLRVVLPRENTVPRESMRGGECGS